MLSDELEALAADAIDLFGVSLKTGGLVRKLRRLAGDARRLEQHQPQVGDAVMVQLGREGCVISMEHARLQKQITTLAERGKK